MCERARAHEEGGERGGTLLVPPNCDAEVRCCCKKRAPAAVVRAESRVDVSPLLRLQVAGKGVVSPVLERNELSSGRAR